MGSIQIRIRPIGTIRTANDTAKEILEKTVRNILNNNNTGTVHRSTNTKKRTEIRAVNRTTNTTGNNNSNANNNDL